MKNKLIFICIAVIILAVAFFLGETGKESQAVTESTTFSTTEPTTEVTTLTTEITTVTTEMATETTTIAEITTIASVVAPVTAVEPQTETTTEEVVYLSVDYKTLIGKYDKATDKDGIVYTGTCSYYDGMTAFDLLRDTLQQEGIPVEFSKTPAYNSVYIEGIDNVYEFDFGELSGWLYSVNDVFLGYSSSEYILSPGDRVQFRYTCDMGKDVGNNYSFSQ